MRQARSISRARRQAILSEIVEGDLGSLRFYHAWTTRVAGMPALVREAATPGEDGFEVYTAGSPVGEIWDLLLHVGDPHGLKPAGLGAPRYAAAGGGDDALRP